ncbi:Acyl-CoA dehydrogenase, C-terminal domain [Saccharopolyspora antimicrobica]|uniref:Acyl-CoA dehydrogenase, C-terminal domain n=1 Tax=Saccharopolyspora antimicrobica TaxID=455193 RepID=A0A1I4SBW5_9PSEU|nr:acyl-CoA dehydrogenase family protein [Saccharopolyspora antimicrobica]RKT87675.1 acyl-CoA dehydrogenase-like protein [Saccharopolyspora antimicrobica]SFM61814.1 Acyl-CoA dehydrogenase, C-terminal domain [Saccharopolyspora antimicrobica]
MSTENSLITEVAADVLSGVDPQAPTGALHPLWPTLVELGWPQVGVAEARGGVGGTLRDLTELVAATAASGVSVPLAEASVARWILGAELESAPLVVAATSTDAVPWARFASHVVVCLERGSAYLVERGEVEPGENLAGEPRDALRLTATTTPLPDAPPHEDVLARSALLNAAALLGAARGAYEHTREHVAQREQFGRPLIALKAVANALAEMRVHLGATETAVARAVRVHEQEPGRALVATAAAKITAARAATSIARSAHQLHGAMGVTREHPLHHVTRKLWAWRDECGTERSWSIELGRIALGSDEPELWERTTA